MALRDALYIVARNGVQDANLRLQRPHPRLAISLLRRNPRPSTIWYRVCIRCRLMTPTKPEDYKGSHKRDERRPALHPDARDAVKRSLRTYAFVGIFLFCATGVTYAIANVPWLDVGEHGFDKWDAWLGISIATLKAGAVASIFMHLNHEKRLIYFFILLAGVHAVGCFIGTYLHYADYTHDDYFYSASERKTSPTP
jgi:cytochrome c oxidase subunit IV